MHTLSRNIKFLTIFFAALLTLSACEKHPLDPLRAIIKEDLGPLPVIAGFTLVTPAAQIRAGSTAVLDLRYWTEGRINKIELWQQPLPGGATTKVAEFEHRPAFSRVTLTDSLRINYTVPANAAPNSQIRLEARVTNVGLENFPRTASLTLRVNP